MFLTLLTLILSQAPIEPPVKDAPVDVFEVRPREKNLVFSWQDAETSVRGEAGPLPLRQGEPVHLAIQVASLAGPAFDGPVTVTLRPRQHQLPADSELFAPKNIDDHQAGEVQTRTKDAGALGWEFEVTPFTSGEYELAVSFRAGRYKVVRGQVEVVSPRVPPIVGPAVAVFLIVCVLAMGAKQVLDKSRSESPQAPPPPDSQAPPT